VDGNVDGTLSVGSMGSISNTLPTGIGAALAADGVEGTRAQFFDGIIDEVRLSDVARTAAWIQTSYNNQGDLGSFYTLGPAEAEPCEGNFDCEDDLNVDGSDASVFKLSFGRSSYKNPCTNVDPCDGDFDCDRDVDGSDAQTLKQDFGRGEFNEPCPPCVAAPWCSYP